MKCPKCKYTAFDYLDACPRCGKDLTPEKAKLNISSIRPNPPSLLGSLTGDLNDNSVEVRVPESIKEGAGDMTLKGEEIYDDGSELDIRIDEEPASGEGPEVELGDLGPSDEGSELDVDLAADKVSIEAAEGAREEKAVGGEESGLEEGGDQENPEKKETEKDSKAIDLDLENLDLKLDFDEDEDPGE
jgi:hypothetical protein